MWLGNTAGSDEGTVRVVLLSAMGAMLIASLAVPHAFGDDGVIFGVAYLAVRVLHLGAYTIVSRDDPQLRAVVVRMATTMLPASVLIVVAGALDGTAQGAHAGWRRWRSTTAASSRAAPRAGASWPATSPSATAWSSSSRWASRSSPSASAPRRLGLDAGIIVGALLGVAVAAALWWAYFDFVALVAARVLRDGGAGRAGAASRATPTPTCTCRWWPGSCSSPWG